MAVFLLVHGSWHGAWCWSRVAPRLEAVGQRAVALDLPAHGADRRPAWRVTFGTYVQSVQAAAAACGAPVIVVGHSMGGMVITQAVANAPELFSAMIYLCAFVPIPGESVFSLGRQDRESLVSESVTLRPTAVRMRKERARAVFYSDCTPEDAEWAASQLCPEPLFPQFGRLRARHPIDLPRAYVECTQDRALSISWQRAMASRASIGSVVTMNSGHSPFLSAPDQLVGHLLELARLAGQQGNGADVPHSGGTPPAGSIRGAEAGGELASRVGPQLIADPFGRRG